MRLPAIAGLIRPLLLLAGADKVVARVYWADRTVAPACWARPFFCLQTDAVAPACWADAIDPA